MDKDELLLGEILDSMVNSISQQERERVEGIICLLKKELDDVKSKDEIDFVKKPNYLNQLVLKNLDIGKGYFLEALLSKVYPTAVHFSSLVFLYSDYDFISKHLSELFVSKEGSSCSVDKASFATKLFREFCITGEIIPFEVNKEDFYKPRFGNSKDWIDYILSLYGLKNGRTKDYLNCYNNLLNKETKKFEYRSRMWSLTLTDTNEVFKIGKTYDKDECHYISESEDKKYYLVPARILGEVDFDLSKGKSLFPKYLVPKNKVELQFTEDIEVL